VRIIFNLIFYKKIIYWIKKISTEVCYSKYFVFFTLTFVSEMTYINNLYFFLFTKYMVDDK